MIAVLIEHTGGKWPFWINPRQVWPIWAYMGLYGPIQGYLGYMGLCFARRTALTLAPLWASLAPRASPRTQVMIITVSEKFMPYA